MNKIILDGKEYELSDELAEKIKAEIVRQDPFERKRADYYYIESTGNVCVISDIGNSVSDDGRFRSGNYCRDKELMEQRALHELLNRQLWRYAEKRNKSLPWDGIQLHYAVCYDYQDQSFVIDEFYISKYNGMIYFDYKKDAALAIEEVVKPFMAEHPEFVW